MQKIIQFKTIHSIGAKILRDYQNDRAQTIDYVAKTIVDHNSQYIDKQNHINKTYSELYNMSTIELLHLYREVTRGMC